MSLRVIAGSARGTKLKAVPGDTTRPIMDRVKEALFSIIGADIFEATFVDLYAGTGSVGIEALSRGAAHAIFVERDRRAVTTIRDNLGRTRLDDRAIVLGRDVFQALKRPPVARADFVFLAPPQYRGLWLRTLHALDGNRAWHDRDCRVVVQIDPSEWVEALHLRCLRETDRRTYGKTMLVFFRFDADADVGELS